MSNHTIAAPITTWAALNGRPRDPQLGRGRCPPRIVLREGEPHGLPAFIDGALLVDLWEDLVLPPAIRAAREPITARDGAAA